MRLKSTLLLLLLVVGLGAFIHYYERIRPGTREREDQARRALRVDPDLVSSLRIESTNGVVACRLEDGRWLLDEPMEAYADKGAVDRILAGLQNLPKGDVISAAERTRHGTTLADYGLEDPQIRITIRQDNRDRTLWVGSSAAVGDGLYVAQAGDSNVAVVVTSTNLLQLVPSAADSVRSRRLLPGTLPKLKRIEVQRASGFLQLVLNDEGQWRILQPVVGRASGAFVQDFAAKFLGALAESFEGDDVLDLAPYGLEEPVAQITLWPKAGDEPHALSLGDGVEESPDRVYATTSVGRSVYTVPRTLLMEANLEADILRDRQLVNLEQARIGYLAIRAGEEEIELTKDDAGDWALTKPVLRDAEDQVAWDLISRWERLRIHRFVTDQMTNLAWLAEAVPAGEVQFAARPPAGETAEAPAPGGPPGGNPDSVLIRAFVDPESPGQILVTLSHENGVYAIDPAAIGEWSVNPADYYARDVLHLADADIRRIVLQRGDGEQIVERDENGVFRPAMPSDGQRVPGAVDRVLAGVASLVVERFVETDTNDLSAFGLLEPTATLTFGLNGEAGLAKTLLFGAPSADPDGVYAMIRGQDSVFVLSHDVEARLLSDLLIRLSPPAPTSDGVVESSGPRPSDAP